MSKGPEQLKFEQAVAGSSSAQVLAASYQWRDNARMLSRVAGRLRNKAADARGISKQTGPAMATAFNTSADAMHEKSSKMLQGADALEQASAKLKAAEDAQTEMRPLHDPGTYSGPSQPKTKQEVAAKGQFDTALSTYQQDKEHNERIARQHNTAMDSQNETSTAVMKSIHGQPDPEPKPTAAGGSTGARNMGGGSTHGSTYSSHAGTQSGTGTHAATWQSPHHGGTASTAGGHHPTGGTDGPGTGTPSGSTVTDPGTPTLTSPLSTPGGPGPSAGASVGGVGAALGAGALGGAGTALGGIRGGSIPTEGSLPSSGARSIGSTTRSSSSGTLGRSAAARAGALSEAEEGTAARSGASRSATGAASRSGAGGRAGAAGQTRSGRGGGRGGAGSPGGGRKNKVGRSGDRDHLVIDEDWVDDEGEAPSVLA